MLYLYYSSIALLVVLSIYRPFITKLDISKYFILGGTSFLIPFVAYYTERMTIISNMKLSTETTNTTLSFYTLSTYTPSPETNLSVLSSINANNMCLLIADAIVFSSITAFSVSVSGLFNRWHFPIIYVKPETNIYLSGLLRHGFSTALVLLAVLSQSSNYNLSLTLTIAGALWYIAGPCFIRRWKSILAVSFITSLFGFAICCTASSHSIIGKPDFSDWCLFGTVVSLICITLDYLDAILNIYPHLVHANKKDHAKIQVATRLSYWIAMIRLVINMPSESDLHPLPIQDLEAAIRVLGPASRSWKTMAALFPVNLRQDLCILYAFFRTADDLVDDAPTPQQCGKNLAIIRRFLRDVFLLGSVQSTDAGIIAANQVFSKSIQADLTLPSHVNWKYYATVLPNDDVLAIFRNFARISHYLCPRAMFELTDAWEHDLKGEPVKKQKDLLNYAALISGTFGELCTCTIMYKTGRGNWGPKNSVSRNEEVLSRARATGQCLQLINIARDIIADSLVGRCYVPLQYMPYPPQSVYNILKVAKNPLRVGEATLKSFSVRILGLADRISNKAQKGIDGLPAEVQDSIRAAFEIYMAIGPTLINDPGFPLRAKVPKSQQQWIAIKCIYGFRSPVVQAIKSTFYEMVSVYSRNFARLSIKRKAAGTTF